MKIKEACFNKNTPEISAMSHKGHNIKGEYKKIKSKKRWTIEKTRKFLLLENLVLFVMLVALLVVVLFSYFLSFGHKKSENSELTSHAEKPNPKILSNNEIIQTMNQKENLDKKEGSQNDDEKATVLSADEIMKIMNAK